MSVSAASGMRGLVAGLDSADALPAKFRPAFLTAPREWFIPGQFWYQPADDAPDVAVDRATDPDHWSSLVYSDRPLVTQFDDGATRWPEIGQRPTSSASMPSVVAGILRELAPKPGDTVLEIGTGTGWNAALLAEIVGAAGHVTTVEIDPAVARQARTNLRAGGYDRVEVIEADAASELAGHDRFDRLIATAGVHVGQLPYWWVRRVHPGGVIVAPMRTDMATGPLVRFVVAEDHTAHGRAAEGLRVSFMDLRSQRGAPVSLSSLNWDDGAAEQSWTELSPWVPLLADDHRWPIAMALPRCRYDVWKATGNRPGVAWLIDPLSRSWATVVPENGRFRVRQSGPRRLWNAAKAAYQWWQHSGEPPLSAWEWAILPDRQTVTLTQ